MIKSFNLAHWRDSKCVPLGYTCSYVPEVLLSLGNLFPVRVSALDVADTEAATMQFSQVTCSYVRTLYEAFLGNSFSPLGGWVFATGCDHLRRLHDVFRKRHDLPFLHILDVPHSSGEAAIEWLEDELRNLAEKIGDFFHVDTTPDNLWASISRFNVVCARIHQINELRKKVPSVVAGSEFHSLMQAVHTSPPDYIIESFENLVPELETRQPAGPEDFRILLIGSVLDDPELIHMIEECGGSVVLDRYCSGSVPGFTPVPDRGDPFRSLAEHVFAKTMCPRMMAQYKERFSTLQDLCQAWSIQGVIVSPLRLCDLWGVETALLADDFRGINMPVLILSRDYKLQGQGQIQTRIEAFFENLE